MRVVRFFVPFLLLLGALLASGDGQAYLSPGSLIAGPGCPGGDCTYIYASASGMIADHQTVTTGNCTAGSTLLSIGSSGPFFTTLDTGKWILADACGPNGLTLKTQIANVVDPQHVNMVATASATGTATTKNNELQTVDDTLPATVQLNNNPITSVISVTNSPPTITYVEGRDYTVDTSGGALTILGGSTIAAGQDILVSYIYNQSVVHWGSGNCAAFDDWREKIRATAGSGLQRKVGVAPSGGVLLECNEYWDVGPMWAPGTTFYLAGDGQNGTACHLGNAASTADANRAGSQLSIEVGGGTPMMIEEIQAINNNGPNGSSNTGVMGCAVRVAHTFGANQRLNLDIPIGITVTGESSGARTSGLVNQIGLYTGVENGSNFKIGSIGGGAANAKGGFCKDLDANAGSLNTAMKIEGFKRLDHEPLNGINCDAYDEATVPGGQNNHYYFSMDGGLNGFRWNPTGGNNSATTKMLFGDNVMRSNYNPVTNAGTNAGIFKPNQLYHTGVILVPSTFTTISGAGCSGTTCNVTSAAAINAVVGEVLQIGNGITAQTCTGCVEVRVVTAVASNVLTLNTALLNTHNPGETVAHRAYVGHCYRMISQPDATSGAVNPAWPTNTLDTVVSGGVTFQETGACSSMTHTAPDNITSSLIIEDLWGTSQGAITLLSMTNQPTRVLGGIFKAQQEAIHCESCSNLDVNSVGAAVGNKFAVINNGNHIRFRNVFTAPGTGQGCAVELNGATDTNFDTGTLNSCLYTTPTPAQEIAGAGDGGLKVAQLPTCTNVTHGNYRNTVIDQAGSCASGLPPTGGGLASQPVVCTTSDGTNWSWKCFGTATSTEGTWTPTITGSTTPGTQTYVFQTGSYERIGRQVTVRFGVAISAKDGAMAGNVQITGLPTNVFNAPNDSGECVISAWKGLTLTASYTQVGGDVPVNQAAGGNIRIWQSGSAQTSFNAITVANIANATQLDGFCTYRAN